MEIDEKRFNISCHLSKLSIHERSPKIKCFQSNIILSFVEFLNKFELILKSNYYKNTNYNIN